MRAMPERRSAMATPKRTRKSRSEFTVSKRLKPGAPEEPIKHPSKSQVSLPSPVLESEPDSSQVLESVENSVSVNDGKYDDDSDTNSDDHNDDNDIDTKDDAAPRAPLSESSSLFRPPTSEEMRTLKETGALFQSSLFRLQVAELAAAVTPTPAHTRPLEQALHRLKAAIDAIPSRTPMPIPAFAASLAAAGPGLAVTVPFGPAPPAQDAMLPFAFERPAKIAIIGSFLLRSLAKQPSGANVDVAVQMPDTLFQDKDHANHRYFQKRACYLSVIAAELRKHHAKSGLSVNVDFEAFQNDLRHPVLVLTSTKASGDLHFSKHGFRIRIFATIASTVFAPARLAPGRNNVRQQPDIIAVDCSSDTLQQAAAAAPATDASVSATPTPHYNNIILQDTACIAHLNFLHRCVTESPSFSSASILARVWLAQRGLVDARRRGYGLGGFLFSMIMGWLLNAAGPYSSRRLGKSLSSYQLLKATLDVIAGHDFSKQPLFLTPTGTEIAEPEFSAAAFLSAFDVAIVDPSGRINLAAHISRSAMDEIQNEAMLSVAMLRDESTDHFDSLFLRNVDRPILKYDNLVRIPRISIVPAAYKSQHAALDMPDLVSYVVRFLPALLKRALGDRVTLVTAYAPAYARWPCNEPWTSTNSTAESNDVTIGVLVHPENSLRAVETGPPADQADAVASFRELWGERAETRRFKDGSIVETVVFDTDDTFQQKSLIVMRMIAHLISRHAQLLPDEDNVTFWAGLGGKFIRAPGIKMTTGSFQPIVDAFQELSRDLCAIKDLPLSITAVHPVSDALRYSSVFVTQPKPSPSEFMDGYRTMVHTHPIVIEFESSSKWPQDLRAVQNMKRAFYIQIGRLLPRIRSGTTTRVSVGTNANVQESGWLDITHQSGYIFRLCIHHEHEAAMLTRAITSARHGGSPADVLHALSAHQTYLTEYVRKPWHASQMSHLCLRHPFLPITIRILKRWLASHLLVSSSKSTGIAEQVLEILAARVYLSPEPYTAPSSGFTGFLRVLDLVQSWDWAEDPLIVELEKGKMTPAMINTIKQKFKASRSTPDKSPSMYITTESDLESAWWTSTLPTRKLLDRLIILARSTLAHATEKLATATDMDISPLFASPLQGYAFVIHLDPTMCSRIRENLTFTPDLAPLTDMTITTDTSATQAPVKRFKNVITTTDRQAILMTEFDPVETYLDDLHAAFGSIAMFFHDKYGGDKITGVWRHGTGIHLGGCPWRVNLGCNVYPQTDHLNRVVSKGVSACVHPNMDAMLAEMQRLGQGLVVAVETR